MRLWGFIILFALATLIGVFIQQDPGYALFSYKEWTIEMPLWLAFLGILVLIIVLMMLFSLLSFLLSTGRHFKRWRAIRKQAKARQYTAQGLLELAQGQWKKAERYLSTSAPYSDAPLVNYLSAAKAAEEEGALKRRDQYLQMAYDTNPKSDIAVKITEAQLQFKHGDYAQSIATLQHLHAEQPKNPQVLKLLATIYEATHDWKSLFVLLPDIRKANIFPDKESLAVFERKIYSALFPLFKEDKRDLIQFWKSAPRSVNNDPKCIVNYASKLHEMGAESEAEAILRSYLQKNWDREICLLYGLVNSPIIKKQLNFAESLLDTEAIHHSALFITLGRLSLANKLWGKARDYLEQSVRMDPTPEAYALLGQLMDRLGETVKRDEYYRKGLMLATTTENR